ASVLLRILEKINDLGQLVPGFVDAGHVVESNPGALFFVVAARLAFPDAHKAASQRSALAGPAKKPYVEGDKEQAGAEAVKKRRQGAALFLRRLGGDLDPVID